MRLLNFLKEQEASIGMPGSYGQAGGAPQTIQRNMGIPLSKQTFDAGMTRKEGTKNWRRSKKKKKGLFPK